MKICPHCNTAVNDDAMFCTTCGTPLEQEPAPTEVLNDNPSGGYYQPPQPEPAQPVYQPPVQPVQPSVQTQIPPVQPQTPPPANMAAPQHSLIEAYKLYWKNYANFNGRTRRSDYWLTALCNFLISLVISIFMIIPVLGYVLSGIWSLAVLIPNLAIIVRRLKDTGKDWPYIFFGLIPLVGWIILIVFAVQDSEFGPNQFGPSPKYPYAQSAYGSAQYAPQPQPQPYAANPQNPSPNGQYPPYN